MAIHWLRFGDSDYRLSFSDTDHPNYIAIQGRTPDETIAQEMQRQDARDYYEDLLNRGWRKSDASTNGNTNGHQQQQSEAKPFTPRVVRNDRNGRSLTTTMSDADACKAFAEHYSREPGHWMWYWIHEYVSRVPKAQPQQNGKPIQNNIAGDGYNAMTFLGDMMMCAIGYGLKKPRLRLKFKDRRYKIYLSKRGTICFKSGALVPLEADANGNPVKWSNDPTGDEEYIGCLSNGQWLPPSRGQDEWRWNAQAHPRRTQLTATEQEFINSLFKAPVEFMAECSKDMGCCCYCGFQLDDPTSKRLGYGPICAKHWGLPWGNKAYTEKAPSFAKSYDDDARNITRALRSNPKPEEVDILWSQFADWLEEKGLPRCKKPERRVVLPRA